MQNWGKYLEGGKGGKVIKEEKTEKQKEDDTKRSIGKEISQIEEEQK